MGQDATTKLLGHRFGRLTVEAYVGKPGKVHLWSCRCDCGQTKTVRQGNLITGHTLSCGCYSLERTAEVHRKHGLCGTPLHTVWRKMLERCFSPNCPEYARYGGRGITVCEEWRDLNRFAADMGPTYRPGLELDRIDNNGQYSPTNCRWASRTQQSRNRRSNRLVTLNGRTASVAEWEEISGISRWVLYHRLNNGWPVEKALTAPIRRSSTELLARQ